MMMLAYVAFRDPLWGGWDYWYLMLLPLALLLALCYKAMRMDDYADLGRQVLRAFLKMVGAFVACALVLYLVVLILEH